MSTGSQTLRPELDAANEPTRWIPEYGGYWLTERYRPACAVLSDTGRFSSRETEIPRHDSAGFVPPIPFNVDPPAHTELRRVLDPSFRKPAIQRLKPAIQAAAKSLCLSLAEHAEFEIMTDFAVPLIATSLHQLLGLPPQQAPAFIERSDELIRRLADPTGTADWGRLPASAGAVTPATPAPPSRQAGGALGEPLEYMITAAVKQRAGGDSGLLADLFRADWKTYFPNRVSDMTNLIVGVIGAAIDNTATVMIHALEHLAIHPADRRILLMQPAAAAQVAEEMLRLYPPVSPGRIVRRDTLLDGAVLRVGDSILPHLRSANRDESIFSDAGNIVLERAAKGRHIAFGLGRHHCVGASLTRLILTVSFIEFHRVFPDYYVSGRSAPIGAGPQRAPLRSLWITPA
jgi:cytochrome P450